MANASTLLYFQTYSGHTVLFCLWKRHHTAFSSVWRFYQVAQYFNYTVFMNKKKFNLAVIAWQLQSRSKIPFDSCPDSDVLL